LLMPSVTKPPPREGGPGVMLSAARPRAVAATCRPADPASSGLRSHAAFTAARSRDAASAGGRAGGGGTGRDAGRGARGVGEAPGSAGSGAVEPGIAGTSDRSGFGRGRLGADGADGGAAAPACGAEAPGRPAGGSARAPGEMKPCAWALGGRTAIDAPASSAIHRIGRGMIDLVAGPQGGAGASARR